MKNSEAFQEHINQAYKVAGTAITLGTAILDNTPIPNTLINLPLQNFNRHGLIAGATGTGKTKTMQLIAELLATAGVPSLLMDLKGDISGLAQAGSAHPKIQQRMQTIGIEYQPQAFPVEFFSLTGNNGAQLRTTVSEFGAVFFAKMLDLNATQESILAMLFKYSSDKNLPLVDLDDVKELIKFSLTSGKEEIAAEYGNISKASSNTILRKIIELEQQGADSFFGEPSIDVNDFCRTNAAGLGIISLLRLDDIQDKPKLFSAFMLGLLSKVYRSFPEVGDVEKPKLVIFIDEAHLIFKRASPAALGQLETIIKLIRSKGVGIFFVTQNPRDISDEVLSQLGLKVQHALRAFTAKDRKAIKLIAENYPPSHYYQTDKLITSLGIGEAAVTVLDEKGRPTPLAATLLQAPKSHMGPINAGEITNLMAQSAINTKYKSRLERTTAAEILRQKLAAINEAETVIAKETAKKYPSNKSWATELSKNTLVRQISRTIFREITRAVMRIFKLRK